MKLKKFALLAASSLVLAACGGGDATESSVVPTIDAAQHIKGTVFGEVFSASVLEGSHPHDNNATVHFSGNVVNGESERGYWDIYAVPKAKGTYACGTSVREGGDILSIEFDEYKSGGNDYYYADGENGSSCSITVADISSTEMSGTFVARLFKDVEGKPTTQVTNGSFRVQLSIAG